MIFKSITTTAIAATIGLALALGSSVTAEAAKKKMKAEAKPAEMRMGFCSPESKPVCGEKGGMRSTFANSCWAANEGAKVVSQGDCKMKGMKGMKGGMKGKKGGKKKMMKKKM